MNAAPERVHRGCPKSSNCYRKPRHPGLCGRIDKERLHDFERRDIERRGHVLPPPSPGERRKLFEHHDTIVAFGAGAPGTIGYVRKTIELSLSQFLVRGNPTRRNIEDCIRNAFETARPAACPQPCVSVHPYRDGYRALVRMDAPYYDTIAIIEMPGEVLKCWAHVKPACTKCDEHNRDRMYQRVASGHGTAARLAQERLEFMRSVSAMQRAAIDEARLRYRVRGFVAALAARIRKVLGR